MRATASPLREARPPGASLLPGRRQRLAVIFTVWTLVGLFYGTRPYLRALSVSKPFPDLNGLLANLADAYVWALLTPAILWLARRFPLQRGRWARSLEVHLPAGALLAVFSVAANVQVSRWLWPDAPAEFFPYFASTIHWNVQWYWIIVGVGHALDVYRRYRDRELRASQLETQLARAQLEALKVQVQPHFLFNTLNTISELVHEDPAEADRMIVRLGDLLRLTVDNAGTQEVALRRELEFLNAYLEIEQARFRDRLTVRMEVDPETLDALVPNLLLQPLVENALHHGIAERPGPGCVTVSARLEGRLEDRRLRLEVRDDGTGLPAGGAVRERVGVGNTRARLRRLYGPDHRFELRGGAGRGVVVTVSIPLRRAPAEGEPAHAFAALAPSAARPAGGVHADPVAGGG
jgi:two-component system LytT family sensor kinase